MDAKGYDISFTVPVKALDALTEAEAADEAHALHHGITLRNIPIPDGRAATEITVGDPMFVADGADVPAYAIFAEAPDHVERFAVEREGALRLIVDVHEARQK